MLERTGLPGVKCKELSKVTRTGHSAKIELCVRAKHACELACVLLVNLPKCIVLFLSGLSLQLSSNSGGSSSF